MSPAPRLAWGWGLQDGSHTPWRPEQQGNCRNSSEASDSTAPWYAPAALCHDGPATTASATPSLHAATWLKSICPLPSERFLSSTEPFYSYRKRQVCVLQLFYISKHITNCFVQINLLFSDLLITPISFLNNRDRYFLSEKGARETDIVIVILSPRHPAVSPLQKQISREVQLFTLDLEDYFSHV